MNKSKYDISDVDIINEAYNNNEVVVKYSDEGSEHEDIVNISTQTQFDRIVVKYLYGFYYDFVDAMTDEAQSLLLGLLQIDDVFDIENISDDKIRQTLEEIIDRGIPIFDFYYDMLLKYGTSYLVDYEYLVFIRKDIFDKLPEDVKKWKASWLYNCEKTRNLFK